MKIAIQIYLLYKKILKKAVVYLNKTDLIGLPTETVYGLGGNAYSKNSIKKIFRLKGRPKSNPLIIHYYSFENALKMYTQISILSNFTKNFIQAQLRLF